MKKSTRFFLASALVFGALGSGCGSNAESGQDSSPRHLLQTIPQGDPFGLITSLPAGIQCSTACSNLFVEGTQVTLTATPDDGWDFVGWQGACTGSATTCTVTMDAAKEVLFSFKRHQLPDTLPTAVDDTVTVLEDSGATALTVLSNDTNTDGGPIVVEAVSQATNGTVVISSGGASVTYTSNTNYNGSDTFTYTLNGGSMATVNVTVTSMDDPPVAVNDAAIVDAGSGPTTVPVLTNDTDIDGGPKLINAVTQAAHGAVVITDGGAGLTYEPTVGYSGTDTFTYTLNGGSQATVTMTVREIILAFSARRPAR